MVAFRASEDAEEGCTVAGVCFIRPAGRFVLPADRQSVSQLGWTRARLGLLSSAECRRP